MPAGFEFDLETLTAAAPFGLAASADGTLVALGRVLQSHVEAKPGDPLSEHFEVVRPAGVAADASMVLGPGKSIRLRPLNLDFELRGHAWWTSDRRHFVFDSTPVLVGLDELKNAGLRLTDFSPTDTTPDMLLSMQTARTAVEDAKRLSEELRVALEQAQAGIASKSRFLAVMSHEIRTPLNGFGSMLDLLTENPHRADASDLIATMDECSRGLMTLLNDILDVSKLEEGQVQLESVPFALRHVLRAATAPFRTRAEAAEVDLRVEIDPSAPEVLLGDPYRLRQVLSNLVGNAVKFTDHGSVVASCRPEGDALVLEVKDTGPGIPESARPRLFEPFGQADVSTTRRFGGTGLGLTISRQLATAMGGTLELSSSGPEGSTFSLRLPARVPVEAVEAVRAPLPSNRTERQCFKGMDVLVADDNPTNRLVVDRLLRRLNATPHLVADGQEAVEAVTARAFDVVLMDVMMPVLDGTAATRQIRALDVAWSGLPVIAFTAGAFAEDRAAAREAGMDDFLEKPVRLDGLEEMLARYCSSHQS